MALMNTNYCNSADTGGYKRVSTQNIYENKCIDKSTVQKVIKGQNQTKTCELQDKEPSDVYKKKEQGDRKLSDTLPSYTVRVNKTADNKYSLKEWKRCNETVLDTHKVDEANTLDYHGQTIITSAFAKIDKMQMENNKRLKQRAKDIFRWKTEVEIACKAIAKEIELLEVERRRINNATKALMIPAAISAECMQLRSKRPITELVADLPEQELLKEISLVQQIKETLILTLMKIEEQLAINKAAKQKIEYDCCDKTVAYNTETVNLGLNTKSNKIMFKYGATRFGDNTAPSPYWAYYSRQTIENTEAVRQASVDLRNTLNSILDGNGRKLREQADRTDKALAESIALTTELVNKLEVCARRTLRSIGETECLIVNLQNSIRKTDAAMKLAQTRLDNRNKWRPHGENVRDQPHFGLILEVKAIHETVSSLRSELKNAERMRIGLMEKRLEIEREIENKRQTLIIDRERCGTIRRHYSSAKELAGL